MTTITEHPHIGGLSDIEAQYIDVLSLLTEDGYLAGIADTGGGCEAIEIALPSDRRLLITDKDELLADDRVEHKGWGIGYYDEDDVQVFYVTTDNGSAKGLKAALDQHVLPMLRQSGTNSAG
ncbi:hypothetical protein [Nocardia brasiliensis]|uniref:hypothetical protein n=1 Tax=Nocardia brasiliensis TaxID=37326 RepID=UPI002455E5E3|nr:hypothetical protein [Nocardia brasiliensis]